MYIATQDIQWVSYTIEGRMLVIKLKLASGATLQQVTIGLRTDTNKQLVRRSVNITDECKNIQLKSCTVVTSISLSTIEQTASFILIVSDWDDSGVVNTQEYTVNIAYNLQNHTTDTSESVIIYAGCLCYYV